MNWLAIRRHYWRWKRRHDAHLLDNPVIQCWNNESISNKQTWKQVEYLVVDTETSSLNPATGELLSIGWVVISNGTIALNSCEHHLLKTKNSVGNSAAIHQIRDCELNDGISTEKMFQHLFKAANNRVLVFHHAPMDMGFLHKNCFHNYKLPMLWPTLDTMRIERRTLESKNLPLRQTVLRLASCRARYNLPPYPAHNALTDALATAELLLAQLAFKAPDTRLKDLY